jgi:Uma2 family endonuclease
MTSVTEEPISPTHADLPPTPISFADFLEWVDEDTHAEWVDGQIIMTSPASDNHQMLRDFLVKVVGVYVDTHRLGWLWGGFLMKTEVRPSGREPDIVFVAEERRNRVTPTYLDGPADLVVEIISPDSIARDRGEKFVEYEAAGIPEYWLLDPLRQEALFYWRGEDQLYHAAPIDAAGIYCSRVLPGFWLDVDWLWQRPLPAIEPILIALGDEIYAYYLLDQLRGRLGDAAIRARLDSPAADDATGG